MPTTPRFTVRFHRPLSERDQASISLYLRPVSEIPRGVPARSLRGVGRIGRSDLAKWHGAWPQDVARVIHFASRHGLQITRVQPERRLIALRGPATVVGPLFGVELQVRRLDQRVFLTHDGPHVLPPELEGIVHAVLGLDRRPRLRRGTRLAPRALVSGASSVEASEIVDLYDFPAQWTGRGQTIGIIALGGTYNEADLRSFLGEATPLPRVIFMPPDSPATSSTDRDDIELMMDIELAAVAAPGARIVVYRGTPDPQGYLEAFAEALHDKENKPSVIATSWGMAEAGWDRPSMTEFDRMLTTAAHLGITVLAAAGDHGSADEVDDGEAHVDFPASSPHLLSCGGTGFAAGAPATEVVWGDGTPQHGTGGGVSGAFGRPAWQKGLTVPDRATGKRGRGVPDIAGHADPSRGYRVRVNGRDRYVGGSSAVPPLMAGLFARINEARGALGALGFANDDLYRPELAQAFVDVLDGRNGRFSASAGWDACTGLGRPIGSALLAALAGGAHDGAHDGVLLAPRLAVADVPAAQASVQRLAELPRCLDKLQPSACVPVEDIVAARTATMEFQRACWEVGSGLDKVMGLWGQISGQDVSDDLTRAFVKVLVRALEATQTSLDSVKTAAAASGTSASKLIGDLQAASTARADEKKALQDKINSIQAGTAALEARIQELKENGEGWAGFWAGVETVFTFGQAGAVKNVEDANNCIFQLNQEYTRQSQLMAQLDELDRQEQAAASALSAVNAAGQAAIDFENTVFNPAVEEIKNCVASAEALREPGESLAALYQRRAQRCMDALSPWGDVF